jgi:hypothetical protein
MNNRPTTLRLLFWPLLLTLLLSIGRLVGEVQGSLGAASGGAGSPFGITWLLFVFGGWFGFRLRAQGSRPMMQPTWLWWGLLLAVPVGAFFWFTRGVDLMGKDAATEANVKQLVTTLAIIAPPTAGLCFAVWPRLAWTLFCYGLGARLIVLGITALAKHMAWDTHYTKFGPAGFEYDFATTMTNAAVAQFGIWVPITMLAGGFVGSWFGRRGS